MSASAQGGVASRVGRGSRWWLVIAVRAGITVVWLLALTEVALLAVFQPAPPNQNLAVMPPTNDFPIRVLLLDLVMGLFVFLPPLSGLALSFDRKHVSTSTGWTPSRLYYLMAIPSPPLSHQRHRPALSLRAPHPHRHPLTRLAPVSTILDSSVSPGRFQQGGSLLFLTVSGPAARGAVPVTFSHTTYCNQFSSASVRSWYPSRNRCRLDTAVCQMRYVIFRPMRSITSWTPRSRRLGIPPTSTPAIKPSTAPRGHCLVQGV